MKLFNFFDNILSVVNKSLKESKSDHYNSINAHQAIIEDFSDQEVTEFYDLGVKETFEPKQNIFDKGDTPDTFHIILEGEAEVYISNANEQGELVSHVLATLVKDEVIGDMALAEKKPRSASVRAKTQLTVLTFKINAIKERPHIILLLTRNMAKILSARLRFTNQVTIKQIEESLAQATARNVLGIFMVAMFWLISLYTLALTSLIVFEKHLSNTTFLSVGLILFFAVGIMSAMRMTGLPLSRFGITWKNWPSEVLQALIYTVPWMLVFLVIKVFLVYFSANPQHIHVISGFDEGMVDGQFILTLYLSAICLYAILCPIQELVARCALQSTFYYFLPGNELFRKWNAIILSNLIFSSVHSHLSFMFVCLTFIPGLFWGWLFHKQRSFIAVSASHIMLGVWVIFIIGVKGVAYG